MARTALAALACALVLIGCGRAASSGEGGPAGTPVAADSTATAAASAGGARTAPARAPEADWPTFGFDAQRTGVGPERTGITAGNVHSLRARVVHIDGTVDAAAIELQGLRIGGRARDVAYLTTTYGRTIAIDAGTGTRLWEYTPADIGSVQGSAQVTTSSPVADPDRRFVYAASPDGLIHKLSSTTGRQVRSGGWPARVTFDATREKLAGALNLDGDSLVVVTSGYIGDAPIYQGHVVLINRVSGRIEHVFNTLCSDRQALIDPPRACPHSDSAIWSREGSVLERGSGRLLIATSNGEPGHRSFDGRTDWGDSVLELSPSARLLHNWTPVDQQRLNDGDVDLGSTEPAIVAVGGRRLAVQGGKAGRLDLLDLDRLNGTTGPAGPRVGGQLATIASPGGDQVLTSPAVWIHHGAGYVFVGDNAGTAAYVVRGGARPTLTRAWSNGTAGTSPVLAGGLLYVYDERDGALVVSDPASGRRIAALGTPGGHWNSPIVAGGRVILPVGSYHTQSTRGEIVIFHLPGR